MSEPIIQEDNSKLDAPVHAESYAERSAASSDETNNDSAEDDFLKGAEAAIQERDKGEWQAADSKEEPTAAAEEKPATEKESAEKPAGEEKPATEEPAVEGKPEIPKPAGWEPKVAKDWKVVNDDRKRLSDEVEQLKQQLSDAITGDQYKQLQADLDEHKKLLASVAAERSPEFQQAYQQQLDSAISKVKRALDGDKLAQAMTLLQNYDPASITGAQLNPLFEDIPSGSQALLQQALTEVDTAYKNKAELIAKSTSNWDQLQLQQKQQAEQTRSARLEEATKVLDKTWKEWSEAGLPALQGGSEEKDQQVAHTRRLAQHIFQGELSDEDAAQAAIWASVARPILDSHLATSKELEEARAEIKKLRGVQPSGGTGASPSHEEPEVDPIKSFEAGLERVWEQR